MPKGKGFSVVVLDSCKSGLLIVQPFGLMMTQQRLSLDAIMVSMCQVLRSWYQSGLVTATDSSLLQGKGGGDKTRPWLGSPSEEYDSEGDECKA